MGLQVANLEFAAALKIAVNRVIPHNGLNRINRRVEDLVKGCCFIHTHIFACEGKTARKAIVHMATIPARCLAYHALSLKQNNRCTQLA